MVEKNTPVEQNPGTGKQRDWLYVLSWAVAFMMVALMAFVFIRRLPSLFAPAQTVEALPEPPASMSLPDFRPASAIQAVARPIDLKTNIPDRGRAKVVKYTVQPGDSIFGIAKEFNLKPESVLWANFDKLQDDPQMVEVGLTLNIPPVDGVYYQWKEGDTLEKVAEKYKANVEDILLWPGNRLDLTNPVIEPGYYIMIPGGKGEFRTWVVPTYWRPGAGANQSIKGQCSNFDPGAGGTGTFIWPLPASHYISGNDFWEGHLAIDIGASVGDQVVASDSGWVVYAGGIGGGYGNMVMIDHGNGYHTLYAHNSQVLVRCGQYVTQGRVIALAGSTGNSTGPHLHFEVRYNGSFLNPWSVLQ